MVKEIPMCLHAVVLHVFGGGGLSRAFATNFHFFLYNRNTRSQHWAVPIAVKDIGLMHYDWSLSFIYSFPSR